MKYLYLVLTALNTAGFGSAVEAKQGIWVALLFVAASISILGLMRTCYSEGMEDGHHAGWHKGVNDAAAARSLDVAQLEREIADRSGDESHGFRAS